MWTDPESDWDFGGGSATGRPAKPSRGRRPGATAFRSPRASGRIIRIAFEGWVLVASAYVGLCWVTLQLADRVAQRPWEVGAGQISAHNDRRLVAVIVMAVLVAATAVPFISWMRRLHTNLSVLGRAPDRPLGRVTAAWFIPFRNLWEPKRIIDDIWLRSTPPDTSGKVPVTVHAWWVAWVAGFFGNVVVLIAVADPVDSVWDARWLLSLAVVLLGASVLGYRTVMLLTARQEEAAAAAGLVARPEGDSAERPWRVAALLAAGVTVAVVVGVAGSVDASDISLSSVDAGSVGDTDVFEDYGITFHYPEGYDVIRRFDPGNDSGVLDIHNWDKSRSIAIEWSTEGAVLLPDNPRQIVSLTLASMTASWDEADRDTTRLGTINGLEVGYATWRGTTDGLGVSGATAATYCTRTDRALVAHAAVNGAAPAEEVLSLLRVILDSLDC